MEPIHIAVIVVGVLVVLLAITMFVGAAVDHAGMMGTGLIGGGIMVVVFLVVGWMALGPEYRLWRASIEKRIAVEEALAEKDSAVHLSEAERIRAQGVADANVIIAESIDEQYIRWLYVNNLADHNASEIIYIPTEGGLPILEANRLKESVGGSD